jgi:hypothetical protein
MVAEQTQQAERLARMETELISVKEYLVRMDGKLDAFTNIYVPRQEINEMFRSRDKEIQELKDSKKDSKTLIAAWAGVIIALGAAITTLVK